MHEFYTMIFSTIKTRSYPTGEDTVVGPTVVGPTVVGPTVVGPMVVGPTVVGPTVVGQHLATRGALPFRIFEQYPKDPSSLGLTHLVLAILVTLASSFMEVHELSKLGTAVKQAQLEFFRHACK